MKKYLIFKSLLLTSAEKQFHIGKCFKVLGQIRAWASAQAAQRAQSRGMLPHQLFEQPILSNATLLII